MTGTKLGSVGLVETNNFFRPNLLMHLFYRSDDLKTLQKQYFVSKLRLHEEKMKLIAAKMEMVKNQGEFYRNMTEVLAKNRKMAENEQ
jgi:hypothetical protein